MRRLQLTSLGAFTTLALAVPMSSTAQVPGAAAGVSGADAPGARLSRDAADAVEVRRGARTVGRPASSVVPPPVIGSHQIDRYDGIEKEQKLLQTNPKSLADWIILGELAHEVAMDAPADVAGKYFKMSSEAFESALALSPDNAGLKAAVQFARDQQRNADGFEKARDRYTDTFLDARRRDLVATGNTPYVKMYEPPAPSRTLPAVASGTSALQPPGAESRIISETQLPPTTPATARGALTDAATDPARPAVNPNTATGDAPSVDASRAVTPPRTNSVATDTANYGTRQDFSGGSAANSPQYNAGPTYRPFVTPAGTPFTYQQYNNAYFPNGVYDNPAVQPVTPQRYVAPSATVVPNALERQILNRATTPARP